jgi:hypothetical protein
MAEDDGVERRAAEGALRPQQRSAALAVTVDGGILEIHEGALERQ